MVKLTPELIAQAPSTINTLKDRELSLRGHKIPAIDNLGVTKVCPLSALVHEMTLVLLPLLNRERINMILST